MIQFKSNFWSTSILLITVVALGIFTTGCSDDSTGSENGGAAFDSGQLGSGESFSYTFEDEGTFDYYCQNHESDMTGEITVSSDIESSEPDTVRMENLTFFPGQLSVAPNTTVVWVNEDTEQHTVTSGTPSDDDGGGYY